MKSLLIYLGRIRTYNSKEWLGFSNDTIGRQDVGSDKMPNFHSKPATGAKESCEQKVPKQALT